MVGSNIALGGWECHVGSEIHEPSSDLSQGIFVTRTTSIMGTKLVLSFHGYKCQRFHLSLIQVDLLEPVSHFLEAARQTLGPENHMNSDTHKAVNFYCVPLQESETKRKHNIPYIYNDNIHFPLHT
ncbi:uncharacterized protein LOC127745707 [Arachis duranensis]|uniref:Uncharacterized protein LOC127745707 n=1 Tax=Arachis duranensis TaxID=130453 RepID=A0A9C6TTM6_ARADU|nr:uncharacterized protein LOC127745707 [Arachis duranensis]